MVVLVTCGWLRDWTCFRSGGVTGKAVGIVSRLNVLKRSTCCSCVSGPAVTGNSLNLLILKEIEWKNEYYERILLRNAIGGAVDVASKVSVFCLAR